MAGEIQCVYTTGRTLYAQVRDSVGQIWNTVGLAFEAYQTANIADYDIALTEQGTASGVYAGDMPAGTIAPGLYSLVVRDRAGGSPAESDVAVADGSIDWTGSAAASGGLSLPAFAPGTDNGLLILGYNDLTQSVTISYGLGPSLILLGKPGLHVEGSQPFTPAAIFQAYVHATKSTDAVQFIGNGSSGAGIRITAGAGNPVALDLDGDAISDNAIDDGTLTTAALAAIATAWGVRVIGNGRTADYFLQGGTNKTVRTAVAFTLYATDDATPLMSAVATEDGTLDPLASVDP